MNIWLDCDNTLFNCFVVDRVLKDLKSPIKKVDVKSWELYELPEDVRQEVLKRFTLKEYMCNLQPIKGGYNKLLEWYAHGHKLNCITSRSLKIKYETEEMIKNTYPVIEKIIVIDGGDKTQYLKQENADLFIDDNPTHVKNSINAGIQSVLISNKNTQYNHSFSMPNLMKAKSIVEINITNGKVNVPESKPKIRTDDFNRRR